VWPVVALERVAAPAQEGGPASGDRKVEKVEAVPIQNSSKDTASRLTLPIKTSVIILHTERGFTVPAYDFRCKACGRTFTVALDSYAELDRLEPQCPSCGSGELSRLIRRVTVVTGEETRVERLADPSRLAGLDEDDPRAMGRLMREMASEVGEDLGPEMDEVIGRLEAGEDPESIEESLPFPDDLPG
jgi:putative FmdB family regulatory protein